MKFKFENFLDDFKKEFIDFLVFLLQKEKRLLVKGDIDENYIEYYKNKDNDYPRFQEYIDLIQEAVIVDGNFYFDIREIIGTSNFYYVNIENFYFELITPKQYLIAKELFVGSTDPDKIVTLNFKPFYEKWPLINERKYIGQGVEYLNRFLSSQMFNDRENWQQSLFNFMRLHKHNGTQLILNDRIKDTKELVKNIHKAIDFLSELEEDIPFSEICHDLQNIGFEIGIGKNVREVHKTLEILDNLINFPDHLALKEFISRIPMIFNIAITSPHGFFGQEGVLGLPDTGGQVVYILDQVKALEKSLSESLEQAGLNVKPKIIILTRLIPEAGSTKCNQRLEKVNHTENSWILRVPFKTENDENINHWISRFNIWPHLDKFAEAAEIELKAEFGKNPDLIIGNYSDGNLVAYLLAKKFNVTQCCIAHALEKSKYLYSALYWKELEEHYNFSLQFSADLIAINSSDFLITSSFQEIAGTEDSIGQYESYRHFTLPDYYRVENGVNPRHTKFNIVSPGVNQNCYFPYSEKENRISATTEKVTKLIFDNTTDEEIFGELENKDKIPIFSMARLDKIKNLTSLVEWFGQSEKLQEKCNLIIIAGKVNRDHSDDAEEKEQIDRMHHFINEYNLSSKIRWLGKLFNKDESGEVYRIIADRKGIFVQPALFEGFGLTVLEAMVSGLPVFATKYGGPLEIIQNNKNGFHINPVDSSNSIKVLEEFIDKIDDSAETWNKISENAIKRVNEKYNWNLYSEKLITLSKIYGFWKYASNFERKDMDAYLDLFYHMLYKPRAKNLSNR